MQSIFSLLMVFGGGILGVLVGESDLSGGSCIVCRVARWEGVIFGGGDERL